MKKVFLITLLTGCLNNILCQQPLTPNNLFYAKLKLFLDNKPLVDLIHINDDTAFDAKRFIEKDFTVNLSTADSVIYLYHDTYTDSLAIQYSLISFIFNDSDKVRQLKKQIDKINRPNFMIEVLTLFKVYYTSHEILVVSSETPFNPLIKKILVSELGLLYSFPDKLPVKKE